MKRRCPDRAGMVSPPAGTHPLCRALRQLPIVEALARALYSDTYGKASQYDNGLEYDHRDAGIFAAINLLRTTRTLAASLPFGQEDVSADVAVVRQLITGARIGRYTFNARSTSNTCEWIVRRAWHMDFYDYHRQVVGERYYNAPPKPQPIVDASSLATCSHVRSLNFEREDALDDLYGLGVLPKLESVRINCCSKLKRLGVCLKLRRFALEGCYNVDFSGLQTLSSCEELIVSTISDVKFINIVHLCQSLRRVYLSYIRTVHDLTLLSASAKTLHTLDVYLCPELRSLAGLEQCFALRYCKIQQCAALRDVTALAGLQCVQVLDLDLCDALRDVSSIGGCVKLNLLELSCQMKVLPTLRCCAALYHLDVSFCRHLRSFSGVAGCRALRTIKACACSALIDIADVASCDALETLELCGGCTSLRDIAPLGECRSLRTLKLAGCTALTDVSALERCTSLRTLSLNGCDSLRGVRLETVTCENPLQWLRH